MIKPDHDNNRYHNFFDNTSNLGVKRKSQNSSCGNNKVKSSRLSHNMTVSDDEHSSLAKDESGNVQQPTDDCRNEKRNKTCAHRKSYSKEVKKRAITLRD